MVELENRTKRSNRSALVIAAVVVLLSWLALGIVAGGCGTREGEAPEDDLETVVAGLSRCATPITSIDPSAPLIDLAVLREIVGEARVVLLGDSRHDASEQFRLKHRIIRFLVEEMGFETVALEESMATALPVDAWVRGGEGDASELVADLGAWYIWDTAEVLEVVRWLREVNTGRGSDHSVRFAGVDISDGAHRGLENVIEFVGRVDSAASAALNGRDLGSEVFSEDFWPESISRYQALDSFARSQVGDRLQRLVRLLQDRRAAYATRSSAHEIDLVLRQAELVLEAHRMFAAFADGEDPGRAFTQAGIIRERAMADTVKWLLEKPGKGGKVVVWAHNAHVAKRPIDFAIPNRPQLDGMVPMGALLADELGGDVVSIGFSFQGAADPKWLPDAAVGTVDDVLAGADLRFGLVDIGSVPSDSRAGDWLRRPQAMRAEGGTMTCVPAHSFNAVAFTKILTPTTRSSASQRRLRSLSD